MPSNNQNLVDTAPDLDVSDKIRRQLSSFDKEIALSVWEHLLRSGTLHRVWSCDNNTFAQRIFAIACNQAPRPT